MAEKQDGIELQIGELDSSRLDLGHPRMFFTPAEIEQARRRIRSEPDARETLNHLLKDADQALQLEMKAPDEGWWDAAQSKPWDQTYPDIYQHTALEPGPLARGAAACATAWLLTGETRYADRACDVLALLSGYRFRAEHFDVGMNYTGWGLPLLTTYDALASRMSGAERGKADALMSRLGAAVLKNDIYWIRNNIGGGLNNHLAWHKAMIGLLGLFYRRADLVAYCISGPRGLLPLLEDGLLDDGLWCESSLTYHFVAIMPMVWFADAQRRSGERPTLYEVRGADGRTLKQPFDAMFNVLAPDGLVPPVGDAYGARTHLWDYTLYESAWAAYGDERYAWVLRRSKKQTAQSLFVPTLPEKAMAPRVSTLLRPEHGYAFLRSHADEAYWDNPEARCAFLTYDRSNVHANADKLSLMLFGQLRMLLSDVEAKATVPHAFSSRVQRELNRGGLSQNTVMIDGADQRTGPRMLRLVEFHDVPEEKRVTAADEEGLLYEGVRQMRTVAMAPAYILDVFQVDCGQRERQIDWIAHIIDDTASAPAEHNPILAACKPFELPKTGAWPWLRHARAADVHEPTRLDWRGAGGRLRLALCGTAAQVILCEYPSTDQPQSPGIPMLMARAHGRQAVFTAVWLIGDAAPDVTVSVAPERTGKLGWQVRCGDRTRTHYVPKLGM
jgi:hypothetical protein